MGLTEHLWYAYGPLEGCIAYYTVWVENSGTWWTYVTCDFYRVVKLTNYDFLSPGWKIAIGSLSTSALAALKI